jgi:hypothetical protein
MPELSRRYIVMAMATEGPFDLRDREAAFVLKPWKDPAALLALQSYRDHCYPELARELDAWIEVIHAGPLALGGVGARNEEHLSKPPTRTAETRRRPGKRPRVVMKVAERKPPRKKRKRAR